MVYLHLSEFMVIDMYHWWFAHGAHGALADTCFVIYIVGSL